MFRHRGEVAEKVIKESGVSITRLAARLGVSRSTLYKKLKDPNLSYEFINKLGELVGHNFALEFPEMKRIIDKLEKVGQLGPYAAELIATQNKYVALLERYNNLLGLLIKLANDNELQTIKKAILRVTGVREL